jgi:hypothetical protein
MKSSLSSALRGYEARACLHTIVLNCMIFHMKTTLIIPDELIRELKRKAADTGQTLSEVVADAVQKGLSRNESRKRLKKLRSFRCGKIFVDVSDREQLYRAMEGK